MDFNCCRCAYFLREQAWLRALPPSLQAAPYHATLKGLFEGFMGPALQFVLDQGIRDPAFGPTALACRVARLLMCLLGDFLPVRRLPFSRTLRLLIVMRFFWGGEMRTNKS